MKNAVKGRDIIERTFELAVRIVKLAGSLTQRSRVGEKLASQIIRSGTSIGANVEEAQAAESRADFIHKYRISLKEARETIYWLKLIAAANLLPEKSIASLRTEADEISRIIAKIIINSKKERKL
ncbi:MAG: four helix bundle protein [Phycisphaerae bacterium]